MQNRSTKFLKGVLAALMLAAVPAAADAFGFGSSHHSGPGMRASHGMGLSPRHSRHHHWRFKALAIPSRERSARPARNETARRSASKVRSFSQIVRENSGLVLRVGDKRGQVVKRHGVRIHYGPDYFGLGAGDATK